MFHNDLQTQTWKPNTNEHPIDRILTGYFNTNNQMKNTKANAIKSETKNIIQRQRVIRSFLSKPDEFEPSIRKPTTLDTTSKSLSITSISSPSSLFTELNEQSTNNNNRQQIIKKDYDYQSSILTRRQRPTIENFSPLQQVSDITNISGNQLTISIPPNFTFRHKPSRITHSDRSSSSSFKIEEQLSSPRIKPLNYSRTINDLPSKQNLSNQKLSHPTHTWTPKFSEHTSNPLRTLTSTLRAKSQLSKHFLHRQQNHTSSKPNYIQDLYISPRIIANPEKKIQQTKFIIEDWDNPKSNHDIISDEEESYSADGNSSTSTCNSQISVLSSDQRSSNHHDLFLENSKLKPQQSTAKRNIPRRRVYNLALPPVAEYLDDDEGTGDEFN